MRFGKVDIEDSRRVTELKKTSVNYSNHVVLTDKPQKIITLERTAHESSTELIKELDFLDHLGDIISAPFKWLFSSENKTDTKTTFTLIIEKVP